MDCVALGSHYASRPLEPPELLEPLEPLASAARRGVYAVTQTWVRPEPGSARPAPKSAAPPQGRRGPRPSRPGPAGSASTSLNPRARTSSRRSRGLSDVLADDQTRPHPNLADDHHAVNAPTNHHAPTSPAPHHTAPRSRTAVSGEKGLASGRRSDSYHRKCVIQLLGWSIAGLPAPGRHPFARGGVRDMLPSGRRADRLASAWLRGC